MNHKKTIIAWALVVGVVLIAGIWYFSMPHGRTVRTETGTMYIPPLTEEVHEQLAQSHGFQYLVSYTDNGFEPASIAAKVGQTVRFTNNASEAMWVSGVGYPGKSACGTSAFDMCKKVGRSEFWEFTFEQAGTWSYKNNADPSKTGTIVVQ